MNNFFKIVGDIKKSPKKKIYEYTDSFFTNIQKNAVLHKDSTILPKINNEIFDVYKLYHQVLEYLEKNKIDDDIEKQRWILENDTDPTERRLAEEKIFEIINRKNPVEDFKKSMDSLIDEYIKICNESIIINFFNRTIKKPIIDLKKIILDIVTLCEEVAPVQINFGDDYKETIEENPDEIEKILDGSGTYKEQNRCSFKAKDAYHNVKHFQTAIRKVQGIHKKEIPAFIFSEIDDFCTRRKISRDDFTIYDLAVLLKLNKQLAKYFRDIHLIYRLYKYVQIIDLSDVEDKLVKMYIQQDMLSKEIKLTSSSKNSINATYMACRLAQFCGRTDLKMQDFFCTKNAKTIQRYDEVIEQRARRLGWLDGNFKDVCR